MERTQNHKRRQASRTRATLVIKARKLGVQSTWSGKRGARLDPASSLCEDLCRRSCPRSPWQEKLLCKIPVQGFLSKVSIRDLHIRDLHRRSLCQRSQSKISAQALYNKRSLSKISALHQVSVQNLSRSSVGRSLGKISATDFYAMSLYKVSRRCPGKISVNGLLARSQTDLYAMSLRKISLWTFPRKLSRRVLLARCM